MKSRGQNSFVGPLGFAAKLYNSLTRFQAVERQHQEIARDLVSRTDHGRILDVGTGPGKLLFELHQLNPSIELFGLDISKAMVHLAKENLARLNVDIRCGDVRYTPYADDFFDCVTCTGSFYLWDNPEECLEEVFRILKRGRSAYLYETHQDFDDRQVRESLRVNLKEESLARRLIAPIFLRRQLLMTYRTADVTGIIRRTRFAESCTIEQISLGNLPAWLRIQLTKSA